jgi:hypothetical protein
MARFYDTASDSELTRIAGLLKKNGIVYTLKSASNTGLLISEIMVAEEDLAFAEFVVSEDSTPNN